MASQDDLPNRRSSPEPHHHDRTADDIRSKNWVHKEALHVALGSILAPKRSAASSNPRSASSTPTPSHSNYHSPGTGTPVHQPHFGSEYLHPHHHAYLYRDTHHASHTPSKLAQSSSSSSEESSPKLSPHPPSGKPTLPVLQIPEPDDHMYLPPARDSYDYPPSPGLGPIDDSDPRLRPLRPTLAPLQPQQYNAKAASSPDGLPITAVGPDGKRRVIIPVGSPKARFFETLQGKSAWDALIHGSFS